MSYVSGQAAATPFFAQGSTTLAQNFKAPAVAQFSFGVQNQLAQSVILVVQYVGNIAWHQNIRRAINTYSLNTPLKVGTNQAFNVAGGPATDYLKYSRANAGDPNNNSGTNPGGTNIPIPDQLRNFDGFGGITEQENNTNGNYNGFQAGLRVQNRWGLSGEVDYTYSHEIDITSTDDAGIDNPFNIKYDKGSGNLRPASNLQHELHLQTAHLQAARPHSLGTWWLGSCRHNHRRDRRSHNSRQSLNYDTVGLGGGYTNRPNQSAKSRSWGTSTMRLTLPSSATQFRHGLAAPTRASAAPARMPSPDRTA